ncbi:MAG: LemA family protein [Phycisphaerae bacterium]|nr:LemA family protein [Phycisphaerae bacterium]
MVAIALGAAAVWAVWAYNRFVRWRNLMREGWSGIDVQLQRRSNLVPNLVETVRGYSAHEQRVLEEVTSLRAQAAQAQSLRERRSAENALTDALKRLLVLVEAYPDLKASTEFARLHQSLVEIEDQLQMARRYYNGTVREFNILVESFPSNLVAGAFRFAPGEFFEIATTSERQAPHVEVRP